MLVWAIGPREISFGLLMEVYTAPKDMVYLREEFFRIPGAVLALWEQEGKYVSALRLEPYRDGLLIAGLLTAPAYRRKGHAWHLIQAVQDKLGSGVKLYSHVNQKNIASLAVHRKCGFRIVQDCARYLDGSVDFKCCTMRYEA